MFKSPNILSHSLDISSKLACLTCKLASGSSREPVRQSVTSLLTQVRHATHGASSIANGPKRRPGRRLGLKRGEGEYVTPNTIIFRQKGTKWHAGENCHLGRDHTVMSSEPGYVRYYSDPLKHPSRKYIGIVLDRADRLPYPPNTPRRRRLGLIAVPMQQTASKGTLATIDNETVGAAAKVQSDTPRQNHIHRTDGSSWPWERYESKIPKPSGPDLSYRISNEDIGRAAEQAGIRVRQYDKNDRWAAWRKKWEKKMKWRMSQVGRKGKQKAGKVVRKSRAPSK